MHNFPRLRGMNDVVEASAGFVGNARRNPPRIFLLDRIPFHIMPCLRNGLNTLPHVDCSKYLLASLLSLDSHCLQRHLKTSTYLQPSIYQASRLVKHLCSCLHSVIRIPEKLRNLAAVRTIAALP